MANILIPLLTAVTQRSKASLIHKTRRTAASQEQFLIELLNYHQNTELGRNYRLGDIKTIDQFKDQVPVLPYSSYEPYFKRMADGEPNVVTPDPLVYLALSSGSTGSHKLVPVTRRSRKILDRANTAAMGFITAAARRQQISIDKMLLTASAKQLGRTPSGISYGYISSSTLQLSNFLYKQVFAQPYDALLVEDTLARHYLCLLFALQNRNLTVIGANFPILALQICAYLEKYADELIWDLKQGSIPTWLKLEPELRLKLESMLNPAPQRAIELYEILRTEGRLTPLLAWPNLALIITARGGTSDFYFERFPDYFGDTPIFGGTYASTEATFGVHYDINTNGTILAIECGFFEFIPSDQWTVDQPKTLLAHEVQVGGFYRILVTNYAGLYRYDMGDVVEVVGFYEQTPLIVFRYRTGGTLSATTEKTTEYHATQVMQALQQDFDVTLEDFCITLSEQFISPYYVLNVELAAGSTLTDPVALLSHFDQKIQEANTSYAVKRSNNDIVAPRLRILTPGSFATLRDRQQAATTLQAHIKMPHISENRQFLAGLSVEQEIQLPDD